MEPWPHAKAVSAAQPEVSRVELLDEVQVKAINIANGKNLPEVPTLMFEFIGTGETDVEPLKHGLSYQFVLVYRLTVGTMVHEGILMYHLYQSPVGLVHTAHTKRYAMVGNDRISIGTNPISSGLHTSPLSDCICVVLNLSCLLLDRNMYRRAWCWYRENEGSMQYLEKELGSGALRTMKRIKSALDPNDIMNPGKLIPPHVCI
ncbi:hypothetical protein BHE74_00003402 [Ensete ventricosum]|nr:hypothetical protein BHE74_00003402 [Ensete ventricosum]